jgi:hypothetical protein
VGVLLIDTYRFFHQPVAKFLIPKHRTLPTAFVKPLQGLVVSFKNKLMKPGDTVELSHHVVDP